MEQFITILEKQKENILITFLRSLSPADKKALVPVIKKIVKEYTEYGQINGGGYGHIKGTDKQREMLQIASFVCFNQADYEKSTYSVWFLNKNKLENIVDWYVPEWFSNFVNKQATRDHIPYYLSYDWLMELTEKGYLQPSKEILAQTLPMTVFNMDTVERKWRFEPEKLYKRKATLEEHIWYLFEADSNVHVCKQTLNYQQPNQEEINWHKIFKMLVAEKRIDRLAVLKSALLASNKNFNKLSSGWFAELFNLLEPEQHEIVSLQKELLSTLSAKHSKPVNTALQEIKKIATGDFFDVDAFLQSVPSLITSNVKTSVNAVLMILEKLLKKHLDHQANICLLLTQTFIQQDMDAHVKAAKLVAKYGDKTAPALQRELQAFSQNMSVAALALLDEFLVAPSLQEHVSSSADEALPTITNIEPEEIIYPQNIEDLVFLASQAFANNEPWHIDVLPAALVKFHTQLKSEDVYKFEPALQQALQLQRNGLHSQHGNLDGLLSCFFIDFGHWLMKKFPENGKSLEAVFKKFDRKIGDKTYSYAVTHTDSSYTNEWSTYKKLPLYDAYKSLLTCALKKINEGDTLPLLSTPTHAFGWIDAAVLSERVVAYQRANKEIFSMDLQVAMARCSFQNKEVALTNIGQNPDAESSRLFTFLLDEEAAPQGPFSELETWLVASLSKRNKKEWEEFGPEAYAKKSIKNYTGELQWESLDEAYTAKEYDYNKRDYVSVPRKHKILKIYKAEPVVKENKLKHFFNKLLHTPTREISDILYDKLNFKLTYTDYECNDIVRVLSLAPRNYTPVIVSTINSCLHDLSGSMSEGDKKFLTALLQQLHMTWQNPGEMEYLLLGSCMLTSSKTVACIAAEIWMNAVSAGVMDSSRLGTIIGIHECIELAPLKRFTDLASQQLFKISSQHNLELQRLIEAIILQLGDEPIKGLKRLLEIYLELIALNNKPVEHTVQARLKVWSSTTTLQKLLRQFQ